MQGFRVVQCHLPSLPLEAPSRLPAVLQIPIPRCAAGIIISHQLSLIAYHSSIVCRGFTLCKTALCIALYASAAPSAHKQSHYVRKTLRATPKGANFRASEGKASSSLECSAERSRKSTQLKLVCEYRTAGLPVGALS